MKFRERHSQVNRLTADKLQKLRCENRNSKKRKRIEEERRGKGLKKPPKCKNGNSGEADESVDIRLTGGRISGGSGGSGTQRMMTLIRWRRSGTIRAYSTARCASRATSVNGSTSSYDRLIQAASELDPSEIAPVSVHRIVIPRRQQNRTHIIVPWVASA